MYREKRTWGVVVSVDEIRWVRASARAWVGEAEVGGWRRGKREERGEKKGFGGFERPCGANGRRSLETSELVGVSDCRCPSHKGGPVFKTRFVIVC